MQENKWRTIAIVFIFLFTIETLWIIWGLFIITQEENKTNECFYNICGEYPNAYYEDDVCECIDYDTFGYEIVAKSKYMK